MKETKKFFENNRLNRGYARITNTQKSDIAIMRERYKHVLPPIDVIAEYEDLRPGTFNRLLNMAESEQNHRHAVDLVTVEKYNNATKLGRLCSLILVALVCATAVILSLQGSMISAISFAVLAFLSTITLASILYAKVPAFKSFDNATDRPRGHNSSRHRYRNKANSR